MMDEKALQFLLRTGAEGAALTEIAGFEPHYRVGSQVVEIPDKIRLLPRRIQQNVDVYDPASFIEYFGAYCNQSSRVFVDRQNAKITAVLDYHVDGASETIEPRWGDHKLNYVFRPTLEWKAWRSNDRKHLSQLDFAQFIEDNLPDIVHPAQSDMLLMSRTFEAKKSVNYSSATRLQSGEVQFVYTEEIRGTAKQDEVVVPEFFTISIAPFEGSQTVEIRCRFRYVLKDATLTLRYEMERPQTIVEAAVQQAVDAIRQKVNNNSFTYGSIAG